MTPQKIRYRYALAKARMLHRELGLSGPPVDIEGIVRSHGIKLGYHFTPGYSIAIRYGTRYVISVNITNPGRDRWSMAHEFGHIHLNHFDDFQGDTPHKCFLSEQQHYFLDREADIFAKELLMPPMWVKRIAGARIGEDTIRRVREEFDVSWEAAIIRLDEMGILPKELAERWLAGRGPG